MLTQRAIAFLRPLVFSVEAKRRSSMLPLAGIYWEDEIPDFRALVRLPKEDRHGIYNLFRIRFKIWRGTELSPKDKAFWETARAQVPDWALFHRLELSDEDRAAQETTKNEAEEFFTALVDEADEVTITEKDGIQSVTADFDLKKLDAVQKPIRPWWKRIFRS